MASALIEAINAANDEDVTASTGTVSNAVEIIVRPERAGIDVAVAASDGNQAITLRSTSAEMVANSIVNLVNSQNWAAANTTHALLASGLELRLRSPRPDTGAVNVDGISVAHASGAVFAGIAAGSEVLIAGASYMVSSVQSPTQLTLQSPATAALANAPYVAPRGGRDGNLIQLCTTSKTSSLTFDRNQIALSGGRSDVTWNCSLDFSGLKIHQFRQCWADLCALIINGDCTGRQNGRLFSSDGIHRVRVHHLEHRRNWQCLI